MKMINAYFEADIVTLVKDKTGPYKYTQVSIGDKQYLKYKTDETFIKDAKILDTTLAERIISQYSILN